MNWIAVHIICALLISVNSQECTDTVGSLSHGSSIVTADKTFILAGYTVPCNSIVVAWEFCYRITAATLTFSPGIWRITGNNDNKDYALVQSNSITYDASIQTNGTSNDQCQRVNLSVTDQFTAPAGSVVGLYSGIGPVLLLHTTDTDSSITTYQFNGNQSSVSKAGNNDDVNYNIAIRVHLGGQFCTDSVDVQQSGDNQIGRDKQAIIPRLNFTCNGRITSIRARVRFNNNGNNYPFFQVWRAASINSTMYNKIGEVQLQSDNQVTGSGGYRIVNIILTGNNTIEVQSGDVVGYYHPPDACYRVKTIQTDGYVLYQFTGPSESVNLNNNTGSNNSRQPLIQFTIVEPSSGTPTGSEDSSSNVGGIVAGCVVGVVVCVIIVVLLILLLVWYQRRKWKNKDTQGDHEHSSRMNTTTTIKDDMANNRTTDNPGNCSKLPDKNELVYMEPTKTNANVHPKALSNVYTNPKASSGDYMAIHKYETPQHSHVPLYYEVVVPSTNGDNAEYSTVGKSLPPNEQLYEDPGHKKEKIYAWFEKKKFRILDRNDIKVSQELGYGEFGMVNLGSWSNGSADPVQVAVKTLNSDCSESDRVKFLREAAIMGQFVHNNVVKLYGVVTEEENMMIVLEYMPKGDLRDLLIKLKALTLPEAYNTLKHDLLSFCRQIAAGMNYLANKQFVHRDLAARNILVSSDDVCKIADFGMARDVADDTYYITSGGKIPLKWTAIEAILYKKYSIQSDVWSFGCIMYEIWSLGCKPFEDLDGKEYVQTITTGYRLPPPPGCPKAIYELMIQCWNPNARDRPVAGSVSETLQKSDRALLTSSVQDNITKDNQSMMLGAPLSAGSQLYLDLQQRYITESS